MRLDGKVAAVTGSLGKLGPIWVEALLEAGAKVLAIDLQDAPSRGALHVCADVRDRESLESARKLAEQKLGPVSILVNNAGIDQPPAVTRTWRIEDMPIELARDILDVNLLGLFQVSQVFGREMVARRSGTIINIGSLYSGVSPDARMYEHLATEPPFLKPPMYGASKAGVASLTRYLATHWGSFGVRVNTLSPGGILGTQDEEFRRKFSNRVPLGRLGTTAELKSPLVFLASDASSYVTGIELRVDGGYTAW